MSTDAIVPVLLALGDDELVLGHRHSEWTGYAPHIEEDVAFSSIAQDEIGHASAYYSLAGRILDEDANAIAFGREPSGYRNALICERPNREWAYTLARHWLYDVAEDLRLESLEGSAHAELSSLCVKIHREERYHLLHADAWLERIAKGPVEGRHRLIGALTEGFRDAMGLFEAFEGEEQALKEEILPHPSADLRKSFVERATSKLDAWGLPTDIAPVMEHDTEFVASSSGDLIETGDPSNSSSDPGESVEVLGGREGRHTDDLAELWEVMTATYRDEPKAAW